MDAIARSESPSLKAETQHAPRQTILADPLLVFLLWINPRPAHGASHCIIWTKTRTVRRWDKRALEAFEFHHFIEWCPINGEAVYCGCGISIANRDTAKEDVIVRDGKRGTDCLMEE